MEHRAAIIIGKCNLMIVTTIIYLIYQKSLVDHCRKL